MLKVMTILHLYPTYYKAEPGNKQLNEIYGTYNRTYRTRIMTMS